MQKMIRRPARTPRLLLTFVASAMATLAVVAGTPARPQLVVGIVVDGLEQDYIDLLRDSFISMFRHRGVQPPAETRSRNPGA